MMKFYPSNVDFFYGRFAKGCTNIKYKNVGWEIIITIYLPFYDLFEGSCFNRFQTDGLFYIFYGYLKVKLYDQVGFVGVQLVIRSILEFFLVKFF